MVVWCNAGDAARRYYLPSSCGAAARSPSAARARPSNQPSPRSRVCELLLPRACTSETGCVSVLVFSFVWPRSSAPPGSPSGVSDFSGLFLNRCRGRRRRRRAAVKFRRAGPFEAFSVCMLAKRGLGSLSDPGSSSARRNAIPRSKQDGSFGRPAAPLRVLATRG